MKKANEPAGEPVAEPVTEPVAPAPAEPRALTLEEKQAIAAEVILADPEPWRQAFAPQPVVTAPVEQPPTFDAWEDPNKVYERAKNDALAEMRKEMGQMAQGMFESVAPALSAATIQSVERLTGATLPEAAKPYLDRLVAKLPPQNMHQLNADGAATLRDLAVGAAYREGKLTPPPPTGGAGEPVGGSPGGTFGGGTKLNLAPGVTQEQVAGYASMFNTTPDDPKVQARLLDHGYITK